MEFVEGPEGCRRVAAAAAETGLSRNVLFNVDGNGGYGEAGAEEGEGFGDEVGCIAGNGRVGAGKKVVWRGGKKKAVA